MKKIKKDYCQHNSFPEGITEIILMSLKLSLKCMSILKNLSCQSFSIRGENTCIPIFMLIL